MQMKINTLKFPLFIVQVSEWYSCRSDCPATYKLTVRLTNSNDETLDTFNFSDTLSDERQNVWHKVNCVEAHIPLSISSIQHFSKCFYRLNTDLKTMDKD